MIVTRLLMGFEMIGSVQIRFVTFWRVLIAAVGWERKDQIRHFHTGHPLARQRGRIIRCGEWAEPASVLARTRSKQDCGFDPNKTG